jgi:hypothetical protein
MVPALVSLALDYYRDPLSYSHLADGAFPLPRGFTGEFSALCSALSRQHIDATATSLGTSADELEAAARFFARHVLLDPSADLYRCLGVSPRAPRDIIRQHYLFLIKLFHPDRLPQASAADVACSRRVNLAYHVLSHAERRAGYDREAKARRRVAYSEPREFFRLHPVPLQAAAPPPAGRAHARRSWAILVSLAVLIGGAGFAMWHLKPMQVLRADGSLAVRAEPPLPYYLRGQDNAAAQQRQPAAPTTGAYAASMAPPILAGADTARTTESDPAAIGTRMGDLLQIALRRGDISSLATLLADSQADARHLRAEHLLQEARATLGADSRLWLALKDMAWRQMPDGTITGNGKAVIAKRSGSVATPEVLSAPMTLELVPVGTDYRIRRFRLHDD